MKKLSICALFFLVFSLTTHAETTKESKINELINIMDMDSIIDQMYLQVQSMIQNNMPERDGISDAEQAIYDKHQKKFLQVMQENMSWKKMEPMMIEIYGRNFSTKEIDDMLAFYKTETGKSLIKKMPVVMQESMQISQTLMKSVIPKIQAISQQQNQELSELRKNN